MNAGQYEVARRKFVDYLLLAVFARWDDPPEPPDHGGPTRPPVPPGPPITGGLPGPPYPLGPRSRGAYPAPRTPWAPLTEPAQRDRHPQGEAVPPGRRGVVGQL